VFLGAVQLLNPLYAVRLGYGPAEIGALSAAGAIAYSIGSPAGGALASRYGVRRVMLWGIAIAALGMALPPLAVLLPAATRLPFLIGGQLVANGGWAFKQVSLVAALAGATSPEARTGAYAVHEAASGAAALAGALLGGALPAAVALLLDAGADPRATDRTGATALHWCATYDQAEIARALIAAGADPDATCALRQTPLHWCATRGAVAVAKVLLDAGADAELRDQAGLSALSLAKAHRHANVAGLLQKAALW